MAHISSRVPMANMDPRTPPAQPYVVLQKWSEKVSNQTTQVLGMQGLT